MQKAMQKEEKNLQKSEALVLKGAQTTAPIVNQAKKQVRTSLKGDELSRSLRDHYSPTYISVDAPEDNPPTDIPVY